MKRRDDRTIKHRDGVTTIIAKPTAEKMQQRTADEAVVRQTTIAAFTANPEFDRYELVRELRERVPPLFEGIGNYGRILWIRDVMTATIRECSA